MGQIAALPNNGARTIDLVFSFVQKTGRNLRDILFKRIDKFYIAMEDVDGKNEGTAALYNGIQLRQNKVAEFRTSQHFL